MERGNGGSDRREGRAITEAQLIGAASIVPVRRLPLVQ